MNGVSALNQPNKKENHDKKPWSTKDAAGLMKTYYQSLPTT